MTDFPHSAYDPRTLSRRSLTLLRSIARAAGEGIHHLTVVLVATNGIGEAECIIEGPALDEDTPNESVVKTAYMLAGTVLGPAMVALRTMDPDGTVTFMSWAVFELVAHPATAEQSHMAYCTGEDRDLTDPLPLMTFVDAPALI
ncbi:hypothetical protein [Streptomyces sp. NPDC002587]